MSASIGLILPALAAQADGVAALDAALLANASATAVLQAWCDTRLNLGLKVRAEVAVRDVRAADDAQAERLKVAVGSPLSYRQVLLKCGDLTLSEAENWYVAERLTDAMNAALAGDTPFGVVVRPLSPSRHNLKSERIWPSQPQSAILRHHAWLATGTGEPIAEVIETYQRPMLDGPR